MNLRQINWKQPKYIFPAVMAVPAGFLIYFVANMFGGSGETEVATDHINMNLPEAKVQSEYDKLRSMENRYSKDGGLFSAVDGFDKEDKGKESLGDDEYSREEIDKIIEGAERKQREQQQLQEMQDRLNASSNRLASRQSSGYSPTPDYGSDVERQLDELHQRSKARMKALLDEPDPDEEERAEANRIAREQAEKAKSDEPSEVIKASSLSHTQFHTVSSNADDMADSPLIKAMIDQTTKATDGTRLRFKLLDDVIIDDVKLLKGSYLYGTVTGFGTQRVKANITSVLAGSRFLKVDLSVYDVDGMEGFYVPASSFREFVQNATAGVAGAQIQFNNNSSTTGINAENLALQALQNIYQAGSSAISRNVKKNKAKIKYNTIVYLINTKNI